MSTDSKLALRSVTVGELARELDVMSHDVLDELIDVGARSFWHEGRKLRSVEELKQYLACDHTVDPLADLEVDLTPTQWEVFAENWVLNAGSLSNTRACVAEETTMKPLRRFVSSEAELPNQAARQRNERIG